MPELQRDVVALRYVEDLPIADIATILEVPEGTIKSDLSRRRPPAQRREEERSMSDFDDQARASGDRIRREAAELAATADPVGRTLPGGRHGTRRRKIAAVAAAVVIGGGVAGLLLTGANESTDLTDDATTTNPATSTATTAATPTTTSESTTSAVAAPTTPTSDPTSTTEPPPVPIMRPIVDPAICTPISAIAGAPSGLPHYPTSGLPLTLFARPSSLPVTIQVIGDPIDGEAKPFALVQRFFDRDRQVVSPDGAESINGVDVALSTYDNGNGEAEWTLPDASTAYLRSRGFDRDQLIDLIAQLSPRPADAPIPGFDYGTGGPPGLLLVAERLNTDPRDGQGTGSQCQVDSTGLLYRTYAITAPDVLTYAAVIDRPPPVDVGVIGDQVLIINGRDDPLAPRATDVIDADEETWRQLLLARGADHESVQLIGGDIEVVVDFVPLTDTSTPVSSLTLRVGVVDGAASIEVSVADAVVADAAEYWKTEINGRIRSRSSALPGEQRGVFGSSLSPAVSWVPGQEFTVRISTTDGDDQTIQTTGEIRLMPATAEN